MAPTSSYRTVTTLRRRCLRQSIWKGRHPCHTFEQSAHPSAVTHRRWPIASTLERAALDLVGPFDYRVRSPGYGEEVDFSQRCILHGLVHVVADDAFVLHKGSASFSTEEGPNPIKEIHDSVIAARYPYYYEWVASSPGCC